MGAFERSRSVLKVKCEIGRDVGTEIKATDRLTNTCTGERRRQTRNRKVKATCAQSDPLCLIGQRTLATALRPFPTRVAHKALKKKPRIYRAIFQQYHTLKFTVECHHHWKNRVVLYFIFDCKYCRCKKQSMFFEVLMYWSRQEITLYALRCLLAGSVPISMPRWPGNSLVLHSLLAHPFIYHTPFLSFKFKDSISLPVKKLSSIKLKNKKGIFANINLLNTTLMSLSHDVLSILSSLPPYFLSFLFWDYIIYHH